MLRDDGVHGDDAVDGSTESTLPARGDGSSRFAEVGDARDVLQVAAGTVLEERDGRVAEGQRRVERGEVPRRRLALEGDPAALRVQQGDGSDDAARRAQLGVVLHREYVVARSLAAEHGGQQHGRAMERTHDRRGLGDG